MRKSETTQASLEVPECICLEFSTDRRSWLGSVTSVRHLLGLLGKRLEKLGKHFAALKVALTPCTKAY